MDKFRQEQLEALREAVKLCHKGGCENAIPFIKRQINWIKNNF